MWIEPDDFTLEPGQTLSAHIFVGEEFSGAPMPWRPNQYTRSEILQQDRSVEISSRLGDRPAIHATPDQPGLTIVAFEMAPHRLTYRDWQKFVNFVEHKDFSTALADHAERGLPDTGFTELYTRHVKALVAVGDGVGSDRVLGLQTEIVALTNPYTDDLSDGVDIRVLYLGEPRANAQVEVFEKSAEGTNVFLLRTDANGQTIVPVKPAHRYLLDAVVLRDTGVEKTDEGPVWESLWAGLTFETP